MALDRADLRAERVVLLTTDNDLARIAARRLAAAFSNLKIIVERPVSRRSLLLRRVKRLGFMHVVGQVGFMVFARLLQLASRKRIKEILHSDQLEPAWPRDSELIEVPSVNSPECIDYLSRLDPQAIMVVGTRILERKTLSASTAPFINYHAGITPKYRGIHGGYWAREQSDLSNFGVTVHLVDPGIDTGAVLYQARLVPSAKDNYTTYPYLQLAAALPLLQQAAQDAVEGKLKPQTVDLPSHLWSHPTIWRYVWSGVRRGAW